MNYSPYDDVVERGGGAEGVGSLVPGKTMGERHEMTLDILQDYPEIMTVEE